MCKHENKKLIDWIFAYGVHHSTYQCLDCGETIQRVDVPIIYKYPPEMVSVNGVEMHQEDWECIKKKERLIEKGKKL
jgi:hypothetical protein